MALIATITATVAAVLWLCSQLFFFASVVIQGTKLRLFNKFTRKYELKDYYPF